VGGSHKKEKKKKSGNVTQHKSLVAKRAWAAEFDISLSRRSREDERDEDKVMMIAGQWSTGEEPGGGQREAPSSQATWE
jgi:hypothetical protein